MYTYEVWRICDNPKSKLDKPLAVFTNYEDSKAFIEEWEDKNRWLKINGRPVAWEVNHCRTISYMNV